MARDLKIKSYTGAAADLGKREQRNLPGKATVLVRLDAESIAVRYQKTDVVTYHEDGRIVLDHGGWHTQTTKYRMREYCPGIQTWVADSTLHVSRYTPDCEPLVECAKMACGVLDTSDQPVLEFKSWEPITIWPDGLMSSGNESREKAWERVEAWHNRPPTPPRAPRAPRFTARKPNPDQLRLAV